MIVVPRQQGDINKVTEKIVSALRGFLTFTEKGMGKMTESALEVAEKLLWKDLIVNYQKAWDEALEKAGGRHYMLEPVPYAELLHEVVYQRTTHRVGRRCW